MKLLLVPSYFCSLIYILAISLISLALRLTWELLVIFKVLEEGLKGLRRLRSLRAPPPLLSSNLPLLLLVLESVTVPDASYSGRVFFTSEVIKTDVISLNLSSVTAYVSSKVLYGYGSSSKRTLYTPLIILRRGLFCSTRILLYRKKMRSFYACL